MVIKVQGSAYALNSAPKLRMVLHLSRLSASEPGEADWIRARGGNRRVHESTCFLRAVSGAAWRGAKPRAGSTGESLGFQLGERPPRTGGTLYKLLKNIFSLDRISLISLGCVGCTLYTIDGTRTAQRSAAIFERCMLLEASEAPLGYVD